MRLAKLSSQKQLKTTKYEQHEWTAKGQMGGFGKRLSGTLSILSSNNSGSCRSIGTSAVNTSTIQQRPSFGNGSCISSSSTNNSCPNKRRKSKTFKCFSSTVFRCCLPCRGGSSPAAPATSPPHTPVPPTSGATANVDNSSVKRKRSGKSSIEISEGTDSFVAAAAAVVKKHSLADTIGTSATTPISLKTLINDEEELDQQFSAADIAAASLASGILPRKAEPETLSDTSISPTVAALQTAAAGGSASASSLLSTTTSLLSVATAAGGAGVNTAAITTQSSPTTPPNTTTTVASQSTIVGSTTNVTVVSTTATTTPTATATATSAANTTATTTSTPSRCCCPPPQTSPLPHIKEEEESEQLLNRQHSVTHEDDTAPTEPTSERQHHHQQLQQSQADQLSPYAANPSGSSDSCTSLSANAVTTSSTTGCTPQEFTTSTPSPRIKHKFRKQHKSGWSRIVLAPSSIAGATSCGAANSSETLASSSINSSSAATVSAVGARLASASASALGAQQSNSSQLLPASKMQAEQGSIGDLQKYHSRYLKNRRHTLANVRSHQSQRSSVYRCRLCTAYHSIRFCPRFLMMTPADRNRAVRKHDYCINCLARSHTFRECRSKNTCQKCQHYHHTLLHVTKRPRIVPPSRTSQHSSRTPPSRHSQRTSPSRHSQPPSTTRQSQRAASSPKPKKQRPKKGNQRTATPAPDQRVLSEAIKSLATVLCASTSTRRHV